MAPPKTEKWLAAMRNRRKPSPEAMASFHSSEYRDLKRAQSTHHGHTTHDGHRSQTYNSWQAMKDRCLNPGRHGYERYGGRGITIDPRWMAFEGFLADMGERPEGTTLDRVDPDGNYTRSNCQWAPWSQQVAHKHRANQFTGVPLPERSTCIEPGCTNLARRLRGPGLCGWHTTKAYRIRHGLM